MAHGAFQDALPGKPQTAHEVKQRLKELSAAIAATRKAGGDASPLIAEHQALETTRRTLAETHTSPDAPSSSGPPRLRIVSSGREWRKLRSAYDVLLARSEALSPFLTREWLDPWQAAFGGNYDLHVILVEGNDGKLLGAAPLMMGRERRGPVWQRVARLLGTGPGLRGNFFSFPVLPESQAVALPLLAQAVHRLTEDCDAVRLEHISPFADGAALLGALLAASPQTDLFLRTEYPCVFGALPRTLEEFMTSVPSASRRAQLRHGDRDLRQQVPVAYEECWDQEQLGEALRQLGRFNSARRRREGAVSSWDDPANIDCRATVAAEFLYRGWLRLDLLHAQGAPVAALMGFAYRGRFFCYNMGFAQEYATYGPGHLLIAHRLAGCIAEGLSSFNFLVGDADYKRQYFREAAPEITITLSREGGRGRALQAATLLLRTLKARRGRRPQQPTPQRT